MRKLVVFISALCVLLAGCQSAPNNAQSSSGDGGITAVASFYPVYILALNVSDGVEGVTVKNLMQAQGGCPHDYQLTTDDMQSLDGADLLLINGAGMEGFLSDIIHSYPNLETVDTSQGTTLVEIEEEGEESFSEDLDDHHDEDYNAHVWLSIPNAVKQVENIRDAFIRVDPDNEDKYRENAKKFSDDMAELTKKIRDSDIAKRQKAAVFHEGFDYFASDFGFDIEVGLYADENANPSAKEMSEAIEDARDENIQLYFAADDSGKKLAETIAAETGGRVILLDPITSGEDNKDAYKQAMEKNIAALEEALGK